MNGLVSPVVSPAADRPISIRTIALASLVGTTIEWYDFFLYGTAAALVFNRLYFPTFDARVGTLAAFATYSVGFVARPLGGVIIGHFGDCIGRKAMLVLTMMIMGLATFCIGLLPTYESWGLWAAVALVVLRFAQGFGVGGEWGGAVLMAVEHAPDNARGFYGSWPQMGVPAGLILATAAFAVVSRLPEPQFLAWGWRLPFLSSIVLVATGLLVRFRVSESPVFESLKHARREFSVPVAEAVRRYPKEILLTMGMRMAENSGFYIFTVFVLAYATQVAGLSRQDTLDGVLLASAGALIALPVCGAISDRIGRRPVYLFGAITIAVFAFPFFWLIEMHSVRLLWVALIVPMVFGEAPMYGPQAAFLAEMFGAGVRYSGASLGAQLASVFAGGLSPFIAAALLPYGGNAIAAYLLAMALITIVAVWLADETRHRRISG
ncbi:MAG: MFS transporter [Acidobacteria bacterium]|nr:MAG: MFS transporter [Acidobacteriota bacterium]